MSIMNQESGRISLLYCNSLKELPEDMVECYCQCFDGSPFTIVVRKEKICHDLTNKSRGWVEVIRHGTAGDTVGITLPAPSLRFGSRIRVKNNQLLEKIS